jgi:diphosphomevalonate decarboxylase
MSRRATFVAPSNIAFVKYWGTRDLDRTLPYNPSISMTLSECVSRCTVEHLPQGRSSEVLVRDEANRWVPASQEFSADILSHLQRLLRWAEESGAFRVATENSFPTGAGIASSASGFAALTLAAAAALERPLDSAEASKLARLSGSGSAARSVLGGYVEWPTGGKEEEGIAGQLAPAAHWTLSDVVTIVSPERKAISSRQGHRRAPSSPYFERRLRLISERLEKMRRAILEQRMEVLGPLLEEEAIDLHLIAMSSKPPIFYWRPGTLSVLQRVRELQSDSVPAFATIDAGPNVHVICPSEHEREVAAAMEGSEGVHSVIRDRVGGGPRETERHLF